MNQFDQFYRRHRTGLFNYLVRLTSDYYLASDVMQEAFIRIWKRYAPQKASKALLYTIARNLYFDHRRRIRPETSAVPEPPDPEPTPEGQVIIRDACRQVLSALGRLDDDEREILAMVASGDLAYRDMAAVLNISQANVKVRVHRARVKLRNIVKREGTDTSWVP